MNEIYDKNGNLVTPPIEQLTIYTWMMNSTENGGLGLRGVELTVFAIIYEYNYTQHIPYMCGIKYLAQLAQCTTRHIIRCLQILCDKNLLQCEHVKTGYFKTNAYTVLLDGIWTNTPN